MFIIAEVGSNFLNLQDCLDSIAAAKECGADCVKFQMYTHKELYGYECEGQGLNHLVLPGQLPREWIPLLHAECERVGIEFMCTAFSPEGYRFIDPYVKRHKIASAENTDMDILETVKAFGKLALISTGGSTIEELVKICEFFETEPLNACNINFMYCVSAYPAKNVNLNAIDELYEEFSPWDVDIGYSCHERGWRTAADAVISYQVSYLEKHFKVRDMETPDNGHSINPKIFKKMVDRIREGYWPLEPDAEIPSKQEADFIKYTKRRFIPELGGYFRTKKPC